MQLQSTFRKIWRNKTLPTSTTTSTMPIGAASYINWTVEMEEEKMEIEEDNESEQQSQIIIIIIIVTRAYGCECECELEMCERFYYDYYVHACCSIILLNWNFADSQNYNSHLCTGCIVTRSPPAVSMPVAFVSLFSQQQSFALQAVALLLTLLFVFFPSCFNVILLFAIRKSFNVNIIKCFEFEFITQMPRVRFRARYASVHRNFRHRYPNNNGN